MVEKGLRSWISLVAEHVQSLLAKWIGDLTITEPPKSVPIKVTSEHYSLQFTVSELLSPSSTPAALVNRNRNGVIIVWNA
jgi:hypothetical protein